MPVDQVCSQCKAAKLKK